MDITEAQIILANLCERIEKGGDGKCRLPGIVTSTELGALELFISRSSAPLLPTSLANQAEIPLQAGAPAAPSSPAAIAVLMPM